MLLPSSCDLRDRARLDVVHQADHIVAKLLSEQLVVLDPLKVLFKVSFDAK